MRTYCLTPWILSLAIVLCGCSSRFTGYVTSIENHCLRAFPDRFAASRVIDATLDDRGGTGYAWEQIKKLLDDNGGLVLSYDKATLYLPVTAIHGGHWKAPFLEPQKIAIVNDGRNHAHDYFVYLRTRPNSIKPIWYSFHSTDAENVCNWIPI